MMELRARMLKYYAISYDGQQTTEHQFWSPKNISPFKTVLEVFPDLHRKIFVITTYFNYIQDPVFYKKLAMKKYKRQLPYGQN